MKNLHDSAWEKSRETLTRALDMPVGEEFLLNRTLYVLIWQSMHCWPKYRDETVKRNSEDIG